MFELVLLRWLCITLAWQGKCSFVCMRERERACLTDFPDVERSHIALSAIKCVLKAAGPLVTRPEEQPGMQHNLFLPRKGQTRITNMLDTENLFGSTRKVLMISRIAAG